MRALKDRYISTFSGKMFHPFDPRPDQIDIRDIAHGLSLLCRFSGQCPDFYSVAEHSIYVANRLPEDLKLAGLLHDASEAYLADLPRPVKVGLPEYKTIEMNVEAVIAEKFGLPFPTPSRVMTVDRELLKLEVFTFFGAAQYHKDFGEPYTLPREHLFGFEPRTAEKKFLHLWAQLNLVANNKCEVVPVRIDHTQDHADNSPTPPSRIAATSCVRAAPSPNKTATPS